MSQESLGPSNNDGANIFRRFRSVVAMAGWDGETLLTASVDTPDRENRNRKRSNLKTPPWISRRKESNKQPPGPATILNVDDDDEDTTQNETEKKVETQNGKEELEMINSAGGAVVVASSIPCMDKLREELSCAICLEICFEPSTTPCGHSFCKNCLTSAVDKCGKRCPKCRQLLGHGRSYTVNTVLWNTIQLLFPNEIEARKVCSSSAEKQLDRQDRECICCHPTAVALRRRIGRPAVPRQDENAALALRRLQMDEEFLEGVRVASGSSNNNNSTMPISLARENVRTSQAINVQIISRLRMNSDNL